MSVEPLSFPEPREDAKATAHVRAASGSHFKIASGSDSRVASGANPLPTILSPGPHAVDAAVAAAVQAPAASSTAHVLLSMLQPVAHRYTSGGDSLDSEGAVVTCLLRRLAQRSDEVLSLMNYLRTTPQPRVTGSVAHSGAAVAARATSSASSKGASRSADRVLSLLPARALWERLTHISLYQYHVISVALDHCSRVSDQQATSIMEQFAQFLSSATAARSRDVPAQWPDHVPFQLILAALDTRHPLKMVYSTQSALPSDASSGATSTVKIAPSSVGYPHTGLHLTRVFRRFSLQLREHCEVLNALFALRVCVQLAQGRPKSRSLGHRAWRSLFTVYPCAIAPSVGDAALLQLPQLLPVPQQNDGVDTVKLAPSSMLSSVLQLNSTDDSHLLRLRRRLILSAKLSSHVSGLGRRPFSTRPTGALPYAMRKRDRG